MDTVDEAGEPITYAAFAFSVIVTDLDEQT